jgi:hypothetical protein
MRSIVKLLISASAALLLAGTLVIAASAVTRRATVAVADANPVLVVGRGFLRGERVALRTSINGQLYKKTVLANNLGRFSTRLAQVDAECWPFAVSAVGARGSRATALRKIVIPPPCSVPIQP